MASVGWKEKKVKRQREQHVLKLRDKQQSALRELCNVNWGWG